MDEPMAPATPLSGFHERHLEPPGWYEISCPHWGRSRTFVNLSPDRLAWYQGVGRR